MAQLVEHNLAKVGVAGSSPVVRSNQQPDYYGSRAFRTHRLGSNPRGSGAFWVVAVALFAANVRFGRIIVGISQNLVARETHPMATEKSSSRSWMSDARDHQIYPRSFKDSTGSGLGDIAGITHRWTILRRLGIGAIIWLSPFYPSPLVDGGYDVADYCDVDPGSARLTTSMT